MFTAAENGFLLQTFLFGSSASGGGGSTFRYVRLRVTGVQNSANQLRVYEIFLLDTTGAPILTGGSMAASAASADATTKLVDFDKNTSWTSTAAFGTLGTVDFTYTLAAPSTVTIGTLDVRGGSSLFNPINVQLQISTDNVNWTTVSSPTLSYPGTTNCAQAKINSFSSTIFLDNPLYKGGTLTISGAGKTVNGVSGNPAPTAFGIKALSANCYWEILINAVDTSAFGYGLSIGIEDMSLALATQLPGTVSCAMWRDGTARQAGASVAAANAARNYTTGTVLGFDFDRTNNTLYVYRNNSLIWTFTGVSTNPQFIAASVNVNGQITLRSTAANFSFSSPHSFPSVDSI